MSSKGGTLNKEEGQESFFMLQAIQQQFERMNVVFNEIRDQIDKQLLLLLGVRSIPKESIILEGKKGMHTWMILMTTTRMSSKMKRINLH